MLERCEVPSCTGSRAKSEMGVLKEGVEELDCVLVLQGESTFPIRRATPLISTIARAFYDDDVVCLIDVLLRERYLRDDDMHVRLSLPAKQLRRTLQFLEEEQLVKHELVDDLAMGGSQNTKFWYIE